MPTRVAILGAGFTGLSAAYYLLKNKDCQVTVFEKDSLPGGLAIGYKEPSWEWTMEKHYHHWFTNDNFILNLAKEIGCQVISKRPKTSVFIKGQRYQLDSPLSLLTFPLLSLIDRLRMVAILGLIRINPFWKLLERINANKFLNKAMGKKAYGMLWEPQLRNKMGEFANEVSLVWFWSRIKKRTPSLAYPKGGYLKFANSLVSEVEKKGGKVTFNSDIINISENDKVNIQVVNKNGKEQNYNFDKVIVTLPSYLFLKIAPQLPDAYRDKLKRLKGLGATNLILRMDKQFMDDNTYWLSICEKNSPVMVVVEHTNFMDKKHFNDEHIIYVGNYPSADSKEYQMDKDELLKLYDPVLKRINPDYQKAIIASTLFKAPFAQPIIPANYSKIIPEMTTPLKNVYLANIEQVYPWDRGTNYAVELGLKVANYLLPDLS